jgi:hypothetical protein
MMIAVFEHLLPGERGQVMPLVWRALKPGGVLFLNQTPHSWFPYEHHSTGIWGINYVPDRCAFWMARHFAAFNKQQNQTQSEEQHLRGGLRGGSEPEVLGHLRAARDGEPEVLQPRQGDRASYWRSCTTPGRREWAKAAAESLFRATDRWFGVVPSVI